jgi:DNA polymerase I-like protein with 3'-5' exonuclease and polymerase domains
MTTATLDRTTTTYQVQASNGTLTIHAPRPGEFNRDAFLSFTVGQMVLGLDMESTALTDRGIFDAEWRLRLVQFGTTDEAWVLDMADPAQWDAAEYVLSCPLHYFVTHTNTEVVAVWCAFGIALSQRTLDTHLLSKIRNPDERAGHDLKELSKRYLDDVLVDAELALHRWFATQAPKGWRGSNQCQTWGWSNIPTDTPEYVIYAGLDAIYTRRLLPELLHEVTEVGHIVHMDHWLAAMTTGVEIQGLRLDLDYTRELLAEYRSRLREADDQINDALGFPARSPKFARWVDAHGNIPDECPRTDKNQDLQLTADDRAASTKIIHPLITVAAQEWSREDRDLLAAREVVAQTANTVSNLEQFLKFVDADGRVHPTINTLRAKTARMSIVRPGMQTLKKPDEEVPGTDRLRRCFIADEGYVFVSADFEQVEIKGLAAHTRDEHLMSILCNGYKIHDVTAISLFGPNFTKTQKTYAKNATFCCAYGGGAKAHSTQAGTPIEESAKIVWNWHSTYPQVKPYAKWLERFDPIVTGSGRRIPADPGRPYASLNYDIQSTCRDMMMQALYNLFTAHPELACTLWLLIHDEVVLMVRREDAPRVAGLLADAMNFTYRGVRITASAEIIGPRWGLPEQGAA